jgi:prophage regulatory protein
VDLIVRKKDLPKFTGLQRSAIDALITKGEFPAPIPLGERSVGWLASEVEDWQAKRIAARDTGTAAKRSGLAGTAALLHQQRLSRETDND